MRTVDRRNWRSRGRIETPRLTLPASALQIYFHAPLAVSARLQVCLNERGIQSATNALCKLARSRRQTPLGYLVGSRYWSARKLGLPEFHLVSGECRKSIWSTLPGTETPIGRLLVRWLYALS